MVKGVKACHPCHPSITDVLLAYTYWGLLKLHMLLLISCWVYLIDCAEGNRTGVVLLLGIHQGTYQSVQAIWKGDI